MLRQFFDYYRPWRTLFWVDFGCAVASGLLELAFPLAIQAFIDRLLGTRIEWAVTFLSARAA